MKLGKNYRKYIYTCSSVLVAMLLFSNSEVFASDTANVSSDVTSNKLQVAQSTSSSATVNNSSSVEATVVTAPQSESTTAPVHAADSSQFPPQSSQSQKNETVDADVYTNNNQTNTTNYKSMGYLPSGSIYQNKQNGVKYDFNSTVESMATTSNGNLYFQYLSQDEKNIFVMGVDKVAQTKVSQNYGIMTNGATNKDSKNKAQFDSLVADKHVTFSKMIANTGHTQAFSSDGTYLYVLQSSTADGFGAATILKFDPEKDLAVSTYAKTGKWLAAYSGNSLYLGDIAFSNRDTFYIARTMDDGISGVTSKPSVQIIKGTISNGNLKLTEFMRAIPGVTKNAGSNKGKVQVQGLTYNNKNKTLNIVYNGVIETFNVEKFEDGSNFDVTYTHLSGNAKNRETEAVAFVGDHTYIFEGQPMEIITNDMAFSKAQEINTNQTGYIQDTDGHWYWFENGNKYTGFKKYMGAYYYFDDGVRLNNQFVSEWGYTYYVGTDGRSVQGVREINGKTYNFGSANTFYLRGDANGYVQLTNDGKWYWFNNGQKFTGFKYYMGAYYYFKNGSRLNNQFVSAWGHTYYVGNDGRAIQGTKVIDNISYYFGNDNTFYERKQDTGYLQATDQKWYWFDHGQKYTGFRFYKGSYYYFVNGVRQQEKFVSQWGHTYYLAANGRSVQGIQIINGKRYNFGVDGTFYLR